MNKKILKTINERKNEYVFCGMIKTSNSCSLYYVGSSNIMNDFEDEFEVVINTIDDFIPLCNWTVLDYAHAIDCELENRNHHNYKITPCKVLNSLPKSITDKEKIDTLLSLYDWII